MRLDDALRGGNAGPLSNRPMVWLALAYVGGIITGSHQWLPGTAAPLSVMCAGLLLALIPKFDRWRMIAPLICIFAAGALHYNVRHASVPGDIVSDVAWERPNTPVILEGRVRQPGLYQDPKDLPPRDENPLFGWRPAQTAYLPFVLDVERIIVSGETRFIAGRTYVRWSNAAGPVFSGETVRVQGRLDPTMSTVNLGIQSLEDHLRRRGVHSQVRANGARAVQHVAGAEPWYLPYWTSRLRDWQADRLRRVVPEEAIPFVFTIWLGDRSGIGQETYQRYLESGTAHILAVSGIHMGILFISITTMLQMRMSRRTRALVLIVIILGFALTAGARTSALRAATMIVIYLIGDLLDRESDAPTALSLAALLFLTINPNVLFDVGFLLSFLSVASILLFTPPIQRALVRIHAPRRLAEPLGATLGVQILPLPVAIHAFHVLPVFGPIVNLVIVPTLGFALWLCFLTAITVPIFEPLSILFGHALLPVVLFIEWTVGLAASSPVSHIKLVSPTWVAVAGLLLAAMAGIYGIPKVTGWRRASLVAILLTITVIVWRPFREEPMIAVLDVGHGDAIVVRTPCGAVLLADGGELSPFVDLGNRVVTPFLYAHGMSYVDAIAVSHADSDHIGGLLHVIEHVRVGTLVMGPYHSGSVLEDELLARADARGVTVQRLSAGERFMLGDTVVDVLHPPEDWPHERNINDASLVLALDWKGARVLLTGDIEATGENRLSGEAVNAHVLKVPHHGSHSSSTQALLDAVEPKVALVSTGRRGGRQPVHTTVTARYGASGIPLWRTDQAGGLRIDIEDGLLNVTSARASRGYPWSGPE